MLQDRFDAAETLAAFITRAEANAAFWKSMYARPANPELIAMGADLPAPRYLLVLLEDWCWDAVNTIPALARVAEAVPRLELRVLSRDRNPDLMDAHLTGGARAIPVVLVLDERFRTIGCWGPRPREIQRWARAHAELPQAERYRELRRRYALDRGRSTVAEVMAIARDGVERVAA